MRSPTSRRTFLKQSATAVAGIGVTTVFSAWSQPVGANNDIRVAAVGLSEHGRSQAKKYAQMKGVRVVALCDPDRHRMQKAVDELDDPRIATYTDYRKLLEDDDIDVVSTASCNHWHAPVTVWGCEAGKDIFVEKPVCHTIWEGQQMVKAARQHNRMVQSGMQLRSDRGVAEAFEWLHEGNLGKILLSRGLCYEERSSITKVEKPTAIPDHIDYDLWCGPSPLVPLMRKELHFDWHWFWDTGNGDLGNQGIHQMDMCRRAIRQDKLAPRVISVGGRFAWHDVGQTANTQLLFFDYDPVPILFEVTEMPVRKGGQVYPKYRGIQIGNVVHCEGGYFACGERGGGWAYDNDGKRIKQFLAGGTEDHLQVFIDAVRSRKREDLSGDVRDGHISSSLCHMGNISHRIGNESPPENIGEELKNYPGMTDAFERFQAHLEAHEVDISKELATLGPPLTMDVDKEQFVGSHADEANRLLTKKYRRGFVITGAVTA